MEAGGLAPPVGVTTDRRIGWVLVTAEILQAQIARGDGLVEGSVPGDVQGPPACQSVGDKAGDETRGCERVDFPCKQCPAQW